MAAKRSVCVRIRGHEFRIRSEDDEAGLQRVADHLEETMALIERRTGTVDSLDLALLTALNLARELVELRESRSGSGPSAIAPKRLRSLIELAESALQPGA